MWFDVELNDDGDKFRHYAIEAESPDHAASVALAHVPTFSTRVTPLHADPDPDDIDFDAVIPADSRSLRTQDAEALLRQDYTGMAADVISPRAMYSALAVFVLDPRLRGLIETADPKAMQQAREALMLS